MKTYQFEATQAAQGKTLSNWGKFLVGVMDNEWGWMSAIDEGHRLLPRIGFGTRQIWVLDLQTCEGAAFTPGGMAAADLDKHRVWVCPMFGPFLEWLYQQDLTDMDALPSLVELPAAPFALAGYRR